MVMEVIKNYLDNVFANFPQTSEIQILKRDMLANMDEKYVMLRQSGKSEHEAAYSVIADFGDIEEITAELGLDIKNEELDTNVFLSNHEVKTYLSKAKKSGILIGFGVWLIIAGVSSTLILDNEFIMFLAIAIAIAIFIVNGSKMKNYESLNETPIQLDDYTREMLERERTKFMTRHTTMVVIGTVQIILTVGAFTIVDVSNLLFLNIIGFSVFLFIIAGSSASSYDILLGKGDYANKIANKQAGQIIGMISVIYWPVVTAIYLLWSFVGDAWDISWVIWPVVGILFGAICAGISIWFETKERKKIND